MHVIASFRHISLAYLVIAVSQTVPKQKNQLKRINGGLRMLCVWARPGSHFCIKKVLKITPPILYCVYKAKTNTNLIPKKNVTKLIIGMTVKVHNSICIALIHTYITYHILYIYIYICMLVGIAIRTCPYV